MNKTKFTLIILAIIFAFADVGYGIYGVVSYFMTQPQNRAPIFYGIYAIVGVLTSIAVIVMLILSIWGKGKYFRQRYGLYMTALMLSVVLSLTSISTILLICTMFISDWVWTKPKDEQIYHKEIKEPSKEERIAQLRQMKDNGLISEEEFQEEVMKLL